MDVGPGAGCWDEVDGVDTAGDAADVAGVALEGARAGAGDAARGRPAGDDRPDVRARPAPEAGGGWTAAGEPGPDVVREAAPSVADRAEVGEDAPGGDACAPTAGLPA